MRRFGLAALTAVSVVALSATAFAADSGSDSDSKNLVLSDGWYASASAGLALMENSSNRSGLSHFDTSPDNPGFAVTGALGRELGNGFRAEGEIGYRQIGIDHVTTYGEGFPSGSATGDSSALSLMANGYYDFSTGGPFTPFVGAGLGVARVGLTDLSIGARPLVDDHDTDFAYQAMGGVSYRLTANGAIFTEYRYFAVNDPTFDTVGGGQVHSDFATHNVEVGYRVAF